LNYSEITTPQVIGTDLIFGLVLAAIGGAFHWKFGAINGLVLGQLLSGGVPGVVLGCALARHVSARKLKLVVATIAIFAGVQLMWNGARTLLANRAAAVAFKVAAQRQQENRRAYRAFPESPAAGQDLLHDFSCLISESAISSTARE
jgi:uncharacterized membrane protein YfcA